MIIITGASRGIGNFLLQRFAVEGQPVMGIYNQTFSFLNAFNIPYFKVDISNEEEISAFIAEQHAQLHRIVLLNCAGVTYNAMAHRADTAEWRHVVDVNLVGTFLVIKNILPLMREQNWGRIVNFSSVVAQRGTPGTSAYAASKAALWGLTRAIAVENATLGITINSLNLGYHDIGMIEAVPPKYQTTLRTMIPMQHFGSPDNIFRAVKYLIDAEYTTGTSLDINGGLV